MRKGGNGAWKVDLKGAKIRACLKGAVHQGGSYF